MRHTASAFWLRAPGQGEIRTVELDAPGPDDVVVRTLFSGVSRGTETLVFRGGVPAGPARADAGAVPGRRVPRAGEVRLPERGRGRAGPGRAARARRCSASTRTRPATSCPAAAVTPLPDDVPPGRAVLAGTVETAVNALWDAAPLVGDRIAVVGGGMVGCSRRRAARPLPRGPGGAGRRRPGARRRGRRRSASGFAAPDDAAGDCDLVVHASATEAGLARSLELLADEGEVIELSWYGDRPVRAPLGEAFHSRRLAIRASQVGAVAPARRGRRSHGDRMALALRLLADPAFDALVTREVAFADLPREMPRIAG